MREADVPASEALGHAAVPAAGQRQCLVCEEPVAVPPVLGQGMLTPEELLVGVLPLCVPALVPGVPGTLEAALHALHGPEDVQSEAVVLLEITQPGELPEVPEIGV